MAIRLQTSKLKMCFNVVFNAFTCTLLVLTRIQIGDAKFDFEANIPEDGKLNFTQLAEKYGRQVEVYNIITQDGYQIELYHLIGNKTIPVLLWHGNLDSSDAYILRGLNSTAVSLNEAGYDIWLGNSRGNRYSRKHNSLNPDKDNEFWDFSFHEMGYYDLPSSIDFILNKTGQPKLRAIGFSMGTTMFYILGSTRPEYNRKVELFISLAPIAYLSNLRNLSSIYPAVWPVISGVLKLRGTKEVFRHQSADNEIIKSICSQGQLAYDICYEKLVMPVTGDDKSQMDPEFFRALLGHFPAGTSIKVLDHFSQIASRKKFAQFDYGPIQNLVKYGAISPPDYDLKKVTMPIALLSGENDNISTPKDVQKLKSELPNVVDNNVLRFTNHIDFQYARDINLDLNPLLKKLLSD